MPLPPNPLARSRRSVLRALGGTAALGALAGCGVPAAYIERGDRAAADVSATDRRLSWANWPLYIDTDDDDPTGRSAPSVADLQSSESHGPRDSDLRPTGAGMPRCLVAQVLPLSAQILDVNDRVARHRDSGSAGSELQLDVDGRMLDDRPGQSPAHLPYADPTLRIRGTRHAPRRWIRPPAAAIVDVVSGCSSGSEARADTSSLCVLAVSTWWRRSSNSSCDMSSSAYASCRRCTAVSRSSSPISRGEPSGKGVTVSPYWRADDPNMPRSEAGNTSAGKADK